jgi:hypothetical protein
MLTREIKIWRQVHHPHIASFFRACLESNPPLLLSQLYIFGNVLEFLSEEPGDGANRIKMVSIRVFNFPIEFDVIYLVPRDFAWNALPS